MSIELEICIACDVQEKAVLNARAASEGGAHRLECCAAMHAGGLTPSPSIIEAVRRAVPDHVQVLVMIRPRDGGFEWSKDEAATMLRSTQDMTSAGANGIVSGALTSGYVDQGLTDDLISSAHDSGLPFTFHRAIDATLDRQKALRTLQDLACDRILTAGTQWGDGRGATSGIDAIEHMADLLEGRMEVVVGGGVSSASLPSLLKTLHHREGISFHAYSSVMKEGLTQAALVRELRRLLSAD